MNEQATEQISNATQRALVRAEQRKQTGDCIVMELDGVEPGAPLEEVTLPDGSSYLDWFWSQVDEFLTETKLELGRRTFGSFYNKMSMSDAGRAILRYHEIPPLPDAGWHRFENTTSMKILKNPPDNLGEIQQRWDAAQGGQS